jgi:organic radical activating enzyme
MYKVANRWDHASAIKVEWNLGKRCNYDCSYCPSEIHDNTSPHTNIEILKATVDKLVSLGKSIRLSFTGGEPTVHPDFRELVTYCKFKGIRWISVTTNGTLPFEFYASLPVDQYVFSIHLEYDWQRVYNTMDKVVDATKIKVIAQIMCHQDYMNSAVTVFARCLQAKIPATLRRIRWTQGDHDLFDDMRYHPDYLNWIKQQESTVQPNTLLFYKDKAMEQRHANDIIKLHLNRLICQKIN